jgi:hypothetical protein
LLFLWPYTLRLLAMAMPANNPLGPVVDAVDPPVPPAADNAMLASAVMPDVPIGLLHTFGGAGSDVAVVQAEMWLDGETGLALWGDQGTYLSSDCLAGLTPDLFYGYAVPMKMVSDQGSLALKWYARAFRATSVLGPPRFRVLVEFDAEQAWDSCVGGDIVMRPAQCSILFKKAVSLVNYPCLRRVTIYDYRGSADDLLACGCASLAAEAAWEQIENE